MGAGRVATAGGRRDRHLGAEGARAFPDWLGERSRVYGARVCSADTHRLPDFPSVHRGAAFTFSWSLRPSVARCGVRAVACRVRRRRVGAVAPCRPSLACGHCARTGRRQCAHRWVAPGQLRRRVAGAARWAGGRVCRAVDVGGRAIVDRACHPVPDRRRLDKERGASVLGCVAAGDGRDRPTTRTGLATARARACWCGARDPALATASGFRRRRQHRLHVVRPSPSWFACVAIGTLRGRGREACARHRLGLAGALPGSRSQRSWQRSSEDASGSRR